LSKDGDDQYPGEVEVLIIYTLEGNQLKIEMPARLTDDSEENLAKVTPINLTNHTYFNLAGHKCE